jgi:hypothetical protein
MWLIVQNMWMYMEAVFSGGDIVKQLPQEAKRFQNIDKQFVKVVTAAIETRNVVQVCYGNELMKNLLPHLTEQLELCQKSLTAFLDTKRAEFPRFYFVSDPTLLEIQAMGKLGQLHCIQLTSLMATEVEPGGAVAGSSPGGFYIMPALPRPGDGGVMYVKIPAPSVVRAHTVSAAPRLSSTPVVSLRAPVRSGTS